MDNHESVSAAARPARGPLSGIRVVEMGSLIAGPFCGQLLGDFGADVVKVEDPVSGDPMREWGVTAPDGTSLSWLVIGRNKRSVTCDLRTERGQELVRRLLAQADVLVENFRPGTLERWGLGPDRLHEINPGLVITRVSGYGQTGPYSRRAGFGSIGEAMGGIRHLTGEPDHPPARAGVSLGDSLAGTFAALGTVMALHHRHSSGRGQVVDSAIYEAVLNLMESVIPQWTIAGEVRGRTGAVLPGVAPSNVYPTSDGAGVLVAANRDTVFVRLAAAMGREDLAADERYATHRARGTNAADLDKVISEWSVGHGSEELLELLHEAGVPAGLVYTARDMLEDPHFRAREAIVRLTHSTLGDVPMQNVSPRLDGSPGSVRALAPELGQDNADVYQGLLGLSSEDVDELRLAGVV